MLNKISDSDSDSDYVINYHGSIYSFYTNKCHPVVLCM